MRAGIKAAKTTAKQQGPAAGTAIVGGTVASHVNGTKWSGATVAAIGAVSAYAGSVISSYTQGASKVFPSSVSGVSELKSTVQSQVEFLRQDGDGAIEKALLDLAEARSAVSEITSDSNSDYVQRALAALDQAREACETAKTQSGAAAEDAKTWASGL